MITQHTKDAAVFKAFCNESRLCILERLRTGEKCACDLQKHINISQSNLSHHMKLLCASGIVSARQEGKWTHYSIDPQGVEAATELLLTLTTVLEAPSNKELLDTTTEGE